MRHLPAVLCLSLSVLVAGCDAASRASLAASSGAATATPGPVPGGVGTLTIEAATVPAGPSFEVTVTDADQNLDPASRDAVTVHARNATTGTEFESFILRETGANTGVFEGSVAVGLEEGDDTVQVAHGDTVLVEYRDRNTTASGACSWQTVQQTAVVDAVRADLRFQSVSVGTPVVGGTVLHVAGTISNHNAQGAATAPATRVRAVVGKWMQSYDDLTDSWVPWFSAFADLGTKPIEALAPGRSQDFWFDYTPPAGQNEIVVQLYADDGNLVPELNEDNNFVEPSVTVTGPDLRIENLTVSQGPHLAGEIVEVSGDVVNVPGGAAAPATTVAVVLGRWVLDYDETVWTQLPTIVRAPVDALDAGPTDDDPNANRFHFTISYPLPTNLSGAYTVKATADANAVVLGAPGVVMERDEANNDSYAGVDVTGADLSFCATPTVTLSIPAAGQITTRVVGDVCNAVGPAAPASKVRAVLGQMIDDWGDLWFNSYGSGQGDVLPIDSGGTQHLDFSFTTSGVPPGSYVVQITVDPYGAVREAIESNNQASVSAATP